VTFLVGVVAGVVLIPALVFGLEVLFAPRAPPAKSGDAPESAPSVAIVVPAHNEAGQIGPTVAHLRAESPPDVRVIVVADNCTDDTANRARSEGASVWIRNDPERRGKGFALRHAFKGLEGAAPDVVVVVDADCRLEPGALQRLARRAHATGAPQQAEYLMTPGESTKSMVSAFAFMVRNRARPRGLARFGWPTHLTGTGMAFPWSSLRDAHVEGGHIVEDLMLGLELARRGHPVQLCSDATVWSELPDASSAALQQRSRWEHGQLHTLLTQAPRLVWEGAASGRPDLVALGLDLAVPPLAFLVMLQVGVFLIAGLLALSGGGVAPLVLSSAGLAVVGGGALLAWWKFGRALLPWYRLIAVPGYVLWKIPVYAAAVLGRRTREWKRTQRASED